MPFVIDDLFFLAAWLAYPVAAVAAKKLGDDKGEQPSYRPAAGHPPVQWAQSNPQPIQYGAPQHGFHAMEAPTTYGPPPIVRIPLNYKDQFTCIATLNSSAGGLIMFEAMIDTGANNSYITHDVARRIGLDPRHLAYSNTMTTPSTVEQFAGLTAPQVSVIEDPNFRSGGLVSVENVRIGVLRDDTLALSVLGMSFLNRLHWTKAANGRELILQEGA